ncbi:MAG: hypothetical protein KDK40_00585, partial [Chlamydiia bacterium]|nr:hypothetical protein [Chlamydiia bacterium]
MDKTHGMAQDWQFTELLPYDAEKVSDENAQFHRVYSSKNQLGDVIHFKRVQLENGVGYFSGQ